MKIALLILLLLPVTSFADIARFQKVTERIYRGGQPGDNDDYQFLKRSGIRTIISVRDDGEWEEDVARRNGLGFKWFPMSAYKAPSDRLVEATLNAMNDPALQPVFIHCLHGKDRTGMMVGIHRVNYQRWSQRAAYDEMIKMGFYKGYVPLVKTFYRWTSNGTSSWLEFWIREFRNPFLLAVPAVADI